MEQKTAIIIAGCACGLFLVLGILAILPFLFMNCTNCVPFSGSVTRSGNDAVFHVYYIDGCYRGGCGIQPVRLNDVQGLVLELIPEGPGAGPRTERWIAPGEMRNIAENLFFFNGTLTQAWRTRAVATVVYKDGTRDRIASGNLGPSDAGPSVFYRGADSPRFVLPTAGGDRIGAVKEKGGYFPDEGFGWGCWLILYTNGTGLYQSYNFHIDKTVPEPGKRRVMTTEPAGNITISSLTEDRLLWSWKGDNLLVDYGAGTKEYAATRDPAGIITSIREVK